MDPFDVLGLSPDATTADTNMSYQQQGFHILRDLTTNPELEVALKQRFIDLSVAHYILSDPQRKQRYLDGQLDPSSVHLTFEAAQAYFSEKTKSWSAFIDQYLTRNKDSKWLLIGPTSGAFLGATIGGPLGAIALGAVGLAAGIFRSVYKKSLVQAALDLPVEQRLEILTAIVNTINSETEPRSSSSHFNQITVEQLSEVSSEPAGPEDPTCVVCMSNRASILTLPCHHVKLCPECCHQIFQTASPICPVCRSPIQKMAKVYT